MNFFEFVTSGVPEYAWDLLVDFCENLFVARHFDLILIRALPVTLKDLYLHCAGSFRGKKVNYLQR